MSTDMHDTSNALCCPARMAQRQEFSLAEIPECAHSAHARVAIVHRDIREPPLKREFAGLRVGTCVVSQLALGRLADEWNGLSSF
jgi:hypothetical protein